MPKVLEAEDIDPIAEEVDFDIQNSGNEPELAAHRFDPNAQQPDLSDGGRIGDVRIRPMPESGQIDFKQKQTQPGRAVVRQVWLWNGRPSTIPLAWNPDGNIHDGGRRYLMKRHCLVCKHSGFFGRTCPQCRKDGRPHVANSIVACYYLRRDQTPEHLHAYGSVPCFVDSCVRRGDYGFRNNTEMRQHAMSKHKVEYRAFMDEQAASQNTETDSLRKQVAELTALVLRNQSGTTMTQAPAATAKWTPERRDRFNEQRRAARARKKAAQAS